MNERRENPFLTNAQPLLLIDTDLHDPQPLLRSIAHRAAEIEPEAFSGSAPCVFLRLDYTPPYQTFRTLRQLILRIREQTGLRSHFRGIVILDATAWIGHEQEEYFSVILKFLYDHRSIWRSAMVLRNCQSRQLSRFAAACACYITPKTVPLRLFEDRELLLLTLRNAFSREDLLLTPAAAELLCDTLMRRELIQARNPILPQRIAREFRLRCPEGQSVTPEQAAVYLTAPDSALAILLGQDKEEPTKEGKNHDPILL